MDLYVPATYTLWWTLAKVAWQSDSAHLVAWPFHVANLALHALATLAVFALLRRLLRRDWPAAAGALIFALHPVQAEAVAWISGAKDLLGGLLVLAALWQYVAAFENADTPTRHRAVHYAIATALLILALLAKPIAVVTPLLAVVIDRLVIGRDWRRIAASAGPWFVLAVPCLVWTKLFQPSLHTVAPAIWQRPLIATDALAFYLYKLAIPLGLAIDYGRNPAAALAAGCAYWTWLVPAAIAALLWWRRREARLPIAAALFAIAALSPLLGLVPFDFQGYSTTADHYLYIPMAGVALAVAWAACHVQPRVAIGAVATVALVLALLSARQVMFWRDSVALFEHTIAVNPDSYAAYSNLAASALREARDEEKVLAVAHERDDAAAEGEHRARLTALNNTYLAFASESCRIRPDSVAACRRVADAMMRLDRPADAVTYLRRAIDAWAKLPAEDQRKFATTHYLLGVALARSGHPAEAIACCRRTLDILPDYAPAQSMLAEARTALAAQRQSVSGSNSKTASTFEQSNP